MMELIDDEIQSASWPGTMGEIGFPLGRGYSLERKSQFSISQRTPMLPKSPEANLHSRNAVRHVQKSDSKKVIYNIFYML